MATVAPGIFRAYDIRGVVGSDLTAEVATLVGKAFGTIVVRGGGSRVLVGRDGRLSGPELSAVLVEGIRSTGCDVAEVGMGPTPVFYFGLHELAADGGIQVTGSHNPPEYNGFKTCVGTQTIYGEAIQRLREMIEADDFEVGEGGHDTADLISAYKAMIHARIKLERPLKIAVDSGNGVAGPIAPEIYREMGCDVIEMYSEVDGNFPNHHPDPTLEEAVEDLQATVTAEGLDLGLGFDGDADRVGLIDENGEIVWGDRLTVLLARDLLERQPGATVIFDVKCSQQLNDDVARHGGTPIMWKTGHSLIKGKMKEEGALLAGEMSGHLFFAENFFGHDDAIYAGAKLMEIASKRPGGFSALLADLPETFSTPEIRYDSTEEAKFEVCERLKEELAREFEVIDIDGVRAVLDGGWGLARASNTGPIIVLRFEAESPERLEEIRQLFFERIQRIEAELGVAVGS
jgi:phosphomannomutase/phosphoglucomutase